MFFRCFAILAIVATAHGFTSFPNSPEAENIGEVDTLDAFLEFIGREPSSWEDITVYDNATDLRANPDPVAVDNYGSNPLDSLTNVQERDTCHKRNGWEKIICEDMPNHKWHWSSGNAFPIRYHSDKLMTWLESLAKNIKEGKDIRDKWRDGKDLDDDLTKRRNLGPVASNSSSLRFSVPGHLGPLSERGIDKNGIHSHYLYNREVGEVWYQGTTASFVDEEPILEPQTTSNSSAEAKPSQSFTLVLQVWRKSEAMPASSLSEQCMAKVMHWHIDRASHTQRFVCTQLDARGDWWAWYNVNINHGMHVVQTNGACCAN